ERVTGRPLPTIKLVETVTPQHRKGQIVSLAEAAPESCAHDVRGEISPDLPIHDEVLQALKNNVKDKAQAIVLVNRRGYAFYLFSLEKRKAVQCPQCSISLTLHLRSTVLRCHYCDFQTTVKHLLGQ